MPRSESDQPWMGPLPAVTGCDCHVCRPDASYDEMDRQTIDAVLRHGWQVLAIGTSLGCGHPDHHNETGCCGDDEDSGPPFAYTIGLGHRVGHPELLMSGLDPYVMLHALNEVAGRIMAGQRIKPGDSLEGVLRGVPVAVEQVADDALAETVLWSGWFHRCKPEALAIVWPSTRGIFAWQPGGSPAVDELQPRAWRSPIEHTGGLSTDPTWPLPIAPDHPVFSCTHVVERGDAVLWAAREPGDTHQGYWTVHCGAVGHTTKEICLVHAARLVRAAPSLAQIAGLGMNQEALRPDTDSPWVIPATPQ